MSKLDMNTVVKFYNHYHNKVKTHPNLYRSGNNQIQIALPGDLLEWCNAASGHTGYGSGARPYGIRRTVDNSETALAEIFSSPESLADFIKSSECDGVAYVNEIRKRHEAKTPKSHKVVEAKPVVKLEDALTAAGSAIRSFPNKNIKLIRDTIIAQLLWFRNTEDAANLAVDMVRSQA